MRIIFIAKTMLNLVLNTFWCYCGRDCVCINHFLVQISMLLTLHLPFKVNIAKIILSRSGAAAMCNFAAAMCTFAAAMCRVGGWLD